MTTSFMPRVRASATFMAAHRYSEETEGYYLALAGFQEALYRLLETPDQGAPRDNFPGPTETGEDILDGSWHESALGEGFYKVRLVDEGGKVDLNLADEPTLRQFVFVKPTVVTIEAVGYRKDSAIRRQVAGVIRLLGGQRGYQVVRWVDRGILRMES